MNNKLISVVVTCHNKGKTIDDCLAAIMKQLVPMEIIVIDDASTDNSPELINRYVDLIISIRYEENQGCCRARNHGASYATGEYIIFVDGDKVLEPDILLGMADVLNQHSEFAFVYGDYKREGDYKQVWPNALFKSSPFDMRQLFKCNYIDTTSLVRRAVCPKWDEEIERLNDWDFWLTLVLQGHIGYYLPEVIFTAHYKDGDISLCGNDDYVKWYKHVIGKHYAAYRNSLPR